jgi:hypothetical protein
MRALALPLAALAPLAAPGGRVLVLGGRPQPGGPFVEEDSPAAGVAAFRRRPG